MSPQLAAPVKPETPAADNAAPESPKESLQTSLSEEPSQDSSAKVADEVVSKETVMVERKTVTSATAVDSTSKVAETSKAETPANEKSKALNGKSVNGNSHESNENVQLAKELNKKVSELNEKSQVDKPQQPSEEEKPEAFSRLKAAKPPQPTEPTAHASGVAVVEKVEAVVKETSTVTEETDLPELTGLEIDVETSDIPEATVAASPGKQLDETLVVAAKKNVWSPLLVSRKYGSTESLEDEAFTILVDLGLVELHPDPDSPDYDSTMDNEFVE
jgi:hypothetical protein